MVQDSRQKEAYAGRESTSTRNPHKASQPAPALAKAWAKLSPEERIIEQWRSAYGCPISDEAKAQFTLHTCGNKYSLSDVRLWLDKHPKNHGQEQGKVYLEFFFDGSPNELTGQEDVFTKAFETMIEQNLQEQRAVEFRQKLAARRRGKASTASEGGESGENVGDDDWKSYLHKPVPATEFKIQSFREAGCMLSFLVCQTSLSVSAAEVLGQISFQEHFPIDGKPQAPSTSTKPLPRWVYWMVAATSGMTMITLVAWWQVVRQFALVGNDAEGMPGAPPLPNTS